MTEVPPSEGDSDDADALYRRASARDAGGPSEKVRSAILNHAARLAAERTARNDAARRAAKRPTMRQAWWRPAAFGTLAAAALAGLLVTPQFIRPTAPTMSASSPAPQNARRSEGAADKAADASVESATTSAPAARQDQYTAPGAPAAQNAPAGSNTGAARYTGSQEIVVTGARRSAVAEQSAKTLAGKPAPQDELQEQAADLQDQRRTARDLNEPSKRAEKSRASTSNATQTYGSLARGQSASDAVTASAAGASPASPASTPPAAAPLAGVTATGGRAVPSPRAEALVDPAMQLRHAAEVGDVAALQALLDKQPDVDARDVNGRTALMLATLRGHAQAVDLLLSAGADPNAADARGATPLQAALAGDQSAIAEALRRAGAR